MVNIFNQDMVLRSAYMHNVTIVTSCFLSLSLCMDSVMILLVPYRFSQGQKPYRFSQGQKQYRLS